MAYVNPVSTASDAGGTMLPRYSAGFNRRSNPSAARSAGSGQIGGRVPQAPLKSAPHGARICRPLRGLVGELAPSVAYRKVNSIGDAQVGNLTSPRGRSHRNRYSLSPLRAASGSRGRSVFGAAHGKSENDRSPAGRQPQTEIRFLKRRRARAILILKVASDSTPPNRCRPSGLGSTSPNPGRRKQHSTRGYPMPPCGLSGGEFLRSQQPYTS